MRLQGLVLLCFACGGLTTNAAVDAGVVIDSSTITDATADGSCTADLLTDPNNCAVCGHACGGAACVGGACQPISLASNKDAFAIALTDTDVVYTNASGELWRVSKAGGPPQMLASALPTDPGNVSGLAVLGGAAYQASYASSAVRRVPLAGGPSQIIPIALPTGVASNGTDVFIASGLSNMVRVSMNGSAGPFGSARSRWAITATSTDVYAAANVNPTALEDVPLMGIATDLAPLACGPCYLATDGAYIFSVNAALVRTEIAPPHTVTVLAKDAIFGGLAVDDKYVYYAQISGGLARVKKLFSLPTTLTTMGTPSAIAVDQTAVYFTSPAGVTKIIKP